MDVQAIYDELAQAYGLPARRVVIAETHRWPGGRVALAEHHGRAKHIIVHPDTPRLGARYLRDTLLHEGVHALTDDQHHDMFLHNPGAHDARFQRTASEMTRRLGLALRPEMDAGDWADWPHSLRPADYYADDLLPDNDPAFVKMLAAHGLTPASNAARAYKADIFRTRLDELFRD